MMAGKRIFKVANFNKPIQWNFVINCWLAAYTLCQSTPIIYEPVLIANTNVKTVVQLSVSKHPNTALIVFILKSKASKKAWGVLKTGITPMNTPRAKPKAIF